MALRQIGGAERGRLPEDFRLLAETEHHVQVAVQGAIDVANHIIAEDSPWTPEDYGSTFTTLARMGVIDASLAERLRDAAGLRNVIVHLYLEVDIERLLSALDHLDDLEEFSTAIEAYLTR